MKLKVEKFDTAGETRIEFVAESDAEHVVLARVAAATWDGSLQVKVFGSGGMLGRFASLSVLVVPVALPGPPSSPVPAPPKPRPVIPPRSARPLPKSPVRPKSPASSPIGG